MEVEEPIKEEHGQGILFLRMKAKSRTDMLVWRRAKRTVLLRINKPVGKEWVVVLVQ